MAGPKIQMLVSESLELKKNTQKLNHKQFHRIKIIQI